MIRHKKLKMKMMKKMINKKLGIKFQTMFYLHKEKMNKQEQKLRIVF